MKKYRIGDIEYFPHSDANPFMVEHIEPDKTFIEKLREWIKGYKTQRSIIFKSMVVPGYRIYKNKESK